MLLFYRSDKFSTPTQFKLTQKHAENEASSDTLPDAKSFSARADTAPRPLVILRLFLRAPERTFFHLPLANEKREAHLRETRKAEANWAGK